MYIFRIISLLVLSQMALVASATQEPDWTLVHGLGEVELRQYEPVVQARTPAPGNVTSSNGFRTLAKYIFGGNEQEKAIAMTAPVERSLTEKDNYMAFYMPEQYDIESLPEPSDDNVTLHPLPARTVAAISFSGWARESVVRDKAQVLLQALASYGIEIKSEPVLAQYNPPWTLPWKRRNEVMVEIQGKVVGRWNL